MSNIDEFAKITINGTMLLGRHIACDGHDHSRKHFVFSHSHSDHVGDFLGTCLHNGQVYTSFATMELLEAIKDDSFRMRSQYNILKFDKPKLIEDSEKLTLIESKHILGASQVEVYDTDEKIKTVYSGDITSDDVPPEKIDYLIVDATHGSPQFEISPDEDSLRRQFVSALSKALKTDFKSVMIHASRGTLQEMMSVISQENFSKYDLLGQRQDVECAKVYKTHGYEMREIICEHSETGESIKENAEWPYIQFTTSGAPSGNERMEEQFGIYFKSYNAGQQMQENDHNAHFLEGSHANYSSLINYIEQASPTTVIVDNFRTQQGQKLAAKLIAKGFDTKCQPM